LGVKVRAAVREFFFIKRLEMSWVTMVCADRR